jgi:hypothetical protein
VSFAARDLTPPLPRARQLDPGGLLPETIETLDYTAEMEFDRPWDIRAIEDRRPQITALDLRELNAVWGGLILRAAGDITVDEAGVPEGALAIRAENWREMVAMAVRAGLIPEQMQGTFEGLLGVVAGLSGDPGGDRRGPEFFQRAHVPRAASRGPRAAPDPALAAVGAGPVGRHVEMEVVAVEPVRIRAQHRAEGPAGRAVRRAQDASFAPRAPVVEHGQFAAIGQTDPRDVDRVAERMFAEPRARL